MTEGTAKKLARMLGPRVDTRGIGSEKDPEKINAIAFELYKESLSVVDLVAHLLDETASVKGGWPRNQAICAGLMVRISKFMLVVTQLSATGDRAEVINVLNRSILESAINMEFLVRTKDEKFFDQFWNDPLNWHTRDGHTLRERKHQWREESDIPGSFSAWP